MKINYVKLETLKPYKEARHAQIANRDGDKFLDGVVVAYRLTLQRLGYKVTDLMSQEFCYNEIERLEKRQG